MILCLFIGQSSITGQTSNDQFSNTQQTIDSLENILKTTSEKEKPAVFNELADIYIGISPKKSKEYADKALKLANNNADKKQESKAYINLGIVFYYMSNYDKSLEYYKKALQILEELGEKKDIAEIYNKIGLVYKNRGNYEKAIEYYNKSLEISQKIGDKQGISASQNNI